MYLLIYVLLDTENGENSSALLVNLKFKKIKKKKVKPIHIFAMHQHIKNKYRHAELVEIQKHCKNIEQNVKNKKSVTNIGKTHTIAGVMAGQKLRSNL